MIHTCIVYAVPLEAPMAGARSTPTVLTSISGAHSADLKWSVRTRRHASGSSTESPLIYCGDIQSPSDKKHLIIDELNHVRSSNIFGSSSGSTSGSPTQFSVLRIWSGNTRAGPYFHVFPQTFAPRVLLWFLKDHAGLLTLFWDQIGRVKFRGGIARPPKRYISEDTHDLPEGPAWILNGSPERTHRKNSPRWGGGPCGSGALGMATQKRTKQTVPSSWGVHGQVG